MAMEAEQWQQCNNPVAMINSLDRKLLTPHKYQLLLIAICRHELSQVKGTRPRLLRGLEVAERYVDGQATVAQIRNASARMRGKDRNGLHGVGLLAASALRKPAGLVSEFAELLDRELDEQSYPRVTHLIREIFPPPGITADTIQTDWLTHNDGVIRKIARAIYEECAFDRLPVLADALMDAGCDNDEILNACRSPGPHVRGNWVIDLILGKGRQITGRGGAVRQ